MTLIFPSWSWFLFKLFTYLNTEPLCCSQIIPTTSDPIVSHLPRDSSHTPSDSLSLPPSLGLSIALHKDINFATLNPCPLYVFPLIIIIFPIKLLQFAA